MNPSFASLKKAEKKFDLKLKSKDLEKACKELQVFFKSEYEQNELDDCYGCGYLVPDEDFDGKLVEECPYCGSEFDYDEEPEEVEEEVEDEETTLLDGLSVDNIEDEEDDTEEENETEDTEEPEESNEDTTEDENENESETEEGSYSEGNTILHADSEPDDLEEDIKPIKTKETLKETVERVTEQKELKVAKKRNNKIVEHNEENYKLSKEQKEDLQKRIKKIKEYKIKFVENTYYLGAELLDLSDSMLWKGIARSFKDFCEVHLEISRSSAYKFMTCASKFSKEQFVQLGVKKADLLSRLPEGKRDEVTEKVIEEKMTFSEISNLLKEKDAPKPEENKTKEREVQKTEVANTKEDTSTILAKVKQDNEIEVPWFDFENHECIQERSDVDKYTIVQVSDEVELVIMENEFGTGLICSFRNRS